MKKQGIKVKRDNTLKYTDIPESVVPKNLRGKEFGVILVFVSGKQDECEYKARKLLLGLEKIIRKM